MPPQRCAAYSADVMTKQFTVEKGEKKSDIDYEMERFIEKHPDFTEIYERTKAMMRTREDLLDEAAHMMYTEDIVESLKKTYASKAKRLERKVEEQAKLLSQVQQENTQKDEMLTQQANRIAELEKKLGSVN